jgi:hypothetical protein
MPRTTTINPKVYLLSQAPLNKAHYPVKKKYYALFWTNGPSDAARRLAMQTLCIELGVRNVRVAAVPNSRVRSHLRAIRQIDAMPELRGRVNLVAEDVLCPEYMPYWLYTLQTIVEKAPPGWGVLQLAHEGDPAILDSPHAPYLPWRRHAARGVVCYAVHPRGRRDILRAFASASPAWPAVDSPVEDTLFTLTPTYTYHVPLFCPQERRKALTDHMVHYSSTVQKSDVYKQERNMCSQILNLRIG